MVIICFILASCGSDDERSVNYVSGEVSEEVYVWQRVWTPEVASADSEYACVELALKRYGKALDLFLKINNTVDAAYIA